MIFWVYDKSSPNPEKWITKEKFDYLISYRKLKRDSQKNSQRVNEAKKLKLRQGHKREDGMIFWCYNKQCSDGIYCVNEQKFQQLQLKARQSKTDWAKKFPHVSCAYPKYRRALKRRAIHPDHDRNDDKKFSAICKILRPEIDLHIDHIVPLDKGGIHHRYNLRLLPAYLNNSKNNRMDSELNPDQQQQCYFWRIMTRVLTATYDHEHQLT
jgi:5-methylcytosine-specific restriction endonuclease McrA